MLIHSLRNEDIVSSRPSDLCWKGQAFHPVCSSMGCLPPLLDTAASRSLITESIVWWFLPQPSIKAKAEELYGYGQDNIGTVGTTNGASLTGLDRFRLLGSSITDNMGVTIRTVATSWKPRWPSLFARLDYPSVQQPAPHRPAVPRSSSGLTPCPGSLS